VWGNGRKFEAINGASSLMKKRIKKKRQSILYECAWCGKSIPEDAPVYTLTGTARPEIDLSKHRGTTLDIPVETANKTIPAIVATEDSELKKRKGHDLLFMLCSQSCGIHLRNVIAEDLGIQLD